MAGIKINDLPQTTSLGDNDLLVAEQQDGTKKITFSFIRNIKNLINYYTKGEIDSKVNTLNKKDSDLQTQINNRGTKDGTLQSNLNADMLDGQHMTYFQKNIVVSNTAPQNPSIGDLWIDTSDD